MAGEEMERRGRRRRRRREGEGARGLEDQSLRLFLAVSVGSTLFWESAGGANRGSKILDGHDDLSQRHVSQEETAQEREGEGGARNFLKMEYF